MYQRLSSWVLATCFWGEVFRNGHSFNAGTDNFNQARIETRDRRFDQRGDSTEETGNSTGERQGSTDSIGETGDPTEETGNSTGEIGSSTGEPGNSTGEIGDRRRGRRHRRQETRSDRQEARPESCSERQKTRYSADKRLSSFDTASCRSNLSRVRTAGCFWQSSLCPEGKVFCQKRGPQSSLPYRCVLSDLRFVLLQKKGC